MESHNITMKEKLNQSIYYIIIGIISVFSLTILPLIGSSIDGQLIYPKTTAGWIVFAITKLTVAFINIMLFHSFVQQGKINIKDNERYIKAKDIVDRINSKHKDNKYNPKSPKKWLTQTYGKKGTGIFFGSVLGSLALTQAILTYDWTTLVSYAVTIFMGLVYGVIQMKKTENYWTEEFYDYAIYLEMHMKEEENKENKGEIK